MDPQGLAGLQLKSVAVTRQHHENVTYGVQIKPAKAWGEFNQFSDVKYCRTWGNLVSVQQGRLSANKPFSEL